MGRENENVFDGFEMCISPKFRPKMIDGKYVYRDYNTTTTLSCVIVGRYSYLLNLARYTEWADEELNELFNIRASILPGLGGQLIVSSILVYIIGGILFACFSLYNLSQLAGSA